MEALMIEKEERIEEQVTENKENIAKVCAAGQQSTYDMSEEEEQEAIAYLRDPGLLDNLTRDIKLVGQVVGEDENQMLAYMSYSSRIFDKPFSFVVTGQSSAGKTALVKGVLKSIPPEDVRVYSSASAKAFEYCTGDQIKNKVVFIEEFDGMKNALATIRLLQSEGRVNTLTVVSSHGERYAVSREVIAPCVIVSTGVIDRLNDENATRIFELTTDDSIDQTKGVVDNIRHKHTIEGLILEEAVIRKQRVMHNAQRLLEPVKVVIPYAEKLRLPNTSARNRRDSERLLTLVKAVAHLRQFQKIRHSVQGISFIEADMDDYAYAYKFGHSVLRNTVSELSDRCWSVLNVICQYHKHIKDENPDSRAVMTLKNIQAFGASLGVDTSNTSNLRRMCQVLARDEYIIDITGGGQGKAAKYRLNYHYKLDAHGDVDTTWRGGALNLTTPDELQVELGGNAPSATKEAAAPGSHTAQRKESVPMNA